MAETVIITGANSGIGKAAAYIFAGQGYQVIMACRNMQSAKPVCEAIKRKTGNSNVNFLQLDISSRSSIYRFCEEYRKKYETLDILIHNAGHFKHGEKKFQRSADGMELTSATNLLGPVLMTELLRDLLSKSANPKVLNACSTNIKHFFDERRSIDFKAMSGQETEGKKYDSYKLYGDSKMGLLMATAFEARRYEQDGICVNAIMIPATKMSGAAIKKVKSYWKLLAVLQTPFLPKQEYIGNAYFSICTSPAYQGITGKLINHRGQTVSAASHSMSFLDIVRGVEVYPPYAENEEAAQKVWNICKGFWHF